MASGHKVLVSGISPAIPKDVLISIFLKFGDMVTMYINDKNDSSGMGCGYVVYKTKLECFRAISELNEQPPYYLIMQYGDISTKGESNREKQPEFSPVQNFPFFARHQKTQKHHTTLESRKYNGRESSPGAENLMLKDKSVNKYAERRLCKDSPQPRSQRTSCREDQDCDTDVLSVCVNKVSSIKEGNEISSKKKNSNLVTQKYIDITDRNSSIPQGVTERRKSVESDYLMENKVKHLKSFQDNLDGVHHNELLKRACRWGESDGKQIKLISGIGRGICAVSDRVNLEPTIGNGYNWEYSIASKSGNQYDGLVTFAGSNGLPGQDIEKQTFEELESTKQTTHEYTASLPGKLEKLISLTNQKKKPNEVKTGDLREPITNLSASVNKKVKDIKSPKVNPPGIPSSLQECVRMEKVSNGVRKNNHKGVRGNDMETQHEVLTKVDKLPAAMKGEAIVTLGKPNTNAKKSNKHQWNLFSDDPRTRIVDYDLCTQQKFLPSDVFIKVTVASVLSPDEYWIQSNDKKELDVVQSLINNRKKSSPDLFEPCLGEYCLTLHNDSWCRGKVVLINETKILIFLIDCGKIISAEAGQLEELPSVVKSIYAQAIHVKIDPRTPADCLNCKEGDILDVKASGPSQKGVTKVQLKGILYAQEVAIPKELSLVSLSDDHEANKTSGTTKEVHWPPSALSLVKEGDEIFCTVLNIVLSEEKDRDEAVVALAFQNIAEDVEIIAEDLQNDCMETPEDPEFNPSVGDLVAAFSSKLNCWVRSIILDAGHRHWLVACFDFGAVEEVTKVHDIPHDKKYRRTAALSAEFHVTKSIFPQEDLFCEGRIEMSATLYVKVLKKKDDCLECKLGINEDKTLCFATLRAWSPKPDCSAYVTLNDKKKIKLPMLELVKLMPGCSVKIVSFYESLVINVQPCDAESKMLMEELHGSITNYAVKNGSLKEDPVMGKKYICRYSGDMKYYRVIVKRVESPIKVHVFYIDYGNEETVRKERLYGLPQEFEQVPCYAVKIELKRDFDIKANTEVRKYLSYVISENREFVLNYPNGNLRSSELLIHNNSLINILKRLIVP